jgi:hypothetical protein
MNPNIDCPFEIELLGTQTMDQANESPEITDQQIDEQIAKLPKEIMDRIYGRIQTKLIENELEGMNTPVSKKRKYDDEGNLLPKTPGENFDFSPLQSGYFSVPSSPAANKVAQDLLGLRQIKSRSNSNLVRRQILRDAARNNEQLTGLVLTPTVSNREKVMPPKPQRPQTNQTFNVPPRVNNIFNNLQEGNLQNEDFPPLPNTQNRSNQNQPQGKKYKLLPIIVKGINKNIINNSVALKKVLMEAKPNAKITEAKALKSGDVLIQPLDPHTVNILLKPWPENENIGKPIARISQSKTTNQNNNIVILGVHPSITDSEVKVSLEDHGFIIDTV